MGFLGETNPLYFDPYKAGVSADAVLGMFSALNAADIDSVLYTFAALVREAGFSLENMENQDDTVRTDLDRMFQEAIERTGCSPQLLDSFSKLLVATYTAGQG